MTTYNSTNPAVRFQQQVRAKGFDIDLGHIELTEFYINGETKLVPWGVCDGVVYLPSESGVSFDQWNYLTTVLVSELVAERVNRQLHPYLALVFVGGDA